jgi:hypothetical protein
VQSTPASTRKICPTWLRGGARSLASPFTAGAILRSSLQGNRTASGAVRAGDRSVSESLAHLPALPSVQAERLSVASGGDDGFFDVYILTRLVIEEHGNVTAENVGVTFSLHEAELHRGDGVANDYETFRSYANWQEDAATTALVIAMREFRSMVKRCKMRRCGEQNEIVQEQFVAGCSASSACTGRCISRNLPQSRTVRQRRSCSKDTMSACSPAAFSGRSRGLRAQSRSGDPRNEGVSRQSEIPAIFEGVFEHDGVLVRVDVLHRRADGRWRLIEVKSISLREGRAPR